jgi:hypothetical protein
MAGVSRKAGDVKLGQRQRWGARMVSSLVVGLAFLLCAKASAEDKDADNAVDKIARFLETCSGKLPEGWSVTSTHPKKIGFIMVDLPKVDDESQIPENWEFLERLRCLFFQGGEKTEKIIPDVSGVREQSLRKMLVLAAQVPNLGELTLQNMSMRELPEQLFRAGGVDEITLRRVRCSRAGIPKEHSLGHVKTLTLEEFQCEDDNSLLVLFSKMSNLSTLKDLESLVSLKGVEFPNLTCLVLSGAGIKSIEGLESKNFPVLNEIYLEKNPELRLDEGMCKEELLQKVEYLKMELGEAYMEDMKDVNVGEMLPKLKGLTLTREYADLMKVCRFGQSSENLKIVLEMNNSDKGFKGLLALHFGLCREAEVEVIRYREQMSQKQYEEIVTGILGKYTDLKRLVLAFTPEQREFSELKFVSSLNERGIFKHLKSFKVIGVDASRIVKPLGVDWKEEFSRVKGTWKDDGVEHGEWILEGF